MPANQLRVRCPVRQWTLLNADGAVSAMSFAVVAGDVEIIGTTTAALPATTKRGWPYAQGQGQLQQTLSELFYAAGIQHVWARPTGSTPAQVVVDYA